MIPNVNKKLKKKLEESAKEINMRNKSIEEKKKRNPKETKTKQSKEEKYYFKIMNNPKISSKAKEHLKRNTKNGTNLDYDDLLLFEKNELMLNEDWDSDIEEEKPKKGRPKKKSEEEQAEERAFLANKAEMKQYLSSLVYSDKIDKEMKNKILEGIESNKINSLNDIDKLISPKKEAKPKKINIKKGNKEKKADTMKIEEENKKAEKEYKKLSKESKRLKPFKDVGEIMKGKSDLVNNKGKLSVDTSLNIKKGLDEKIKRALKKSINAELERFFKGN